MLKHLSQRFTHLKLVNILIDKLEQCEFVIKQALNIYSASIMHLLLIEDYITLFHYSTSKFLSGDKIK